MRNFFFFVAALIVILPLAYAVIALRGDNDTDPIVKLLGPGKTPAQCVERMRPHFDRMEQAMTEIATALLESDDLNEVAITADRDGKLLLLVNPNEGDYREPTQEENEFYISRYESFGKYNYYAPGRFSLSDNHVSVFTNATCGIPVFEWAAYRIGIDLPLKRTSELARIGYIYSPEGFSDIETCIEPVMDPDPVIVCEKPLDEHWLWYSEWWEPLEISDEPTD